MVAAAEQGVGVALVPPVMFSKPLESGILVQPFPTAIDLGSYWLTWLKSRQQSQALRLFHAWLTEQGVGRP
jgi:LysR family transcriptional regulator of beta-lactamase